MRHPQRTKGCLYPETFEPRLPSLSRPLDPFFIEFFAVPFPTLGISLPSSGREFLQFALEIAIVVPRNMLQMLPDSLIDGFARGAQLLSRSLYNLLFDGEGYVHLHSIRAHIYCVKSGA
jgi:hypothetical protein